MNHEKKMTCPLLVHAWFMHIFNILPIFFAGSISRIDAVFNEVRNLIDVDARWIASQGSEPDSANGWC